MYNGGIDMDSNVQKLEDFEVLKGIINKDIKIEHLDDDVKIRLINLCTERIDIVNRRIQTTQKKIDKATCLIKKLQEN